jgi:hypothetical protein
VKAHIQRQQLDKLYVDRVEGGVGRGGGGPCVFFAEKIRSKSKRKKTDSLNKNKTLNAPRLTVGNIAYHWTITCRCNLCKILVKQRAR